jgi:hypothetical protein
MGKAQSDSGSTHNYNDVFNPTTRLLNILVLRTSAILRSLHPKPHASRISEKDNLAFLRDRSYCCLEFSVGSLSAKRPQNRTSLAQIIGATSEAILRGSKHSAE